MVASLIICPHGDIRYIDALFLASNAATQGGLNTVDLNALHIYQQITLWCVSIVTNTIFIHSSLVLVRLYWFDKRFHHIVQEANAARRLRLRYRRTDSERYDREIGQTRGTEQCGPAPTDAHRDATSTFGLGSPGTPDESGSDDEEAGDKQDDRKPSWTFKLKRPRPSIPNLPISLPQYKSYRERRPLVRNVGNDDCIAGTSDGVGKQAPSSLARVSNVHSSIDESELPRFEVEHDPLLHPEAHWEEEGEKPTSRARPWQWVLNTFRWRGRDLEKDAAEHSRWNTRRTSVSELDETHREKLGGIEYRALKTLFVVLLCYYTIFLVVGSTCLIPWIYTTETYGSIVKSAGINRAWWGIFTATSAFHNLGFSLIPTSMTSFQSAPFPVLVMTFLIIIGNTGFPCMLRFVIWILSKITSCGSPLWEELKFLLDYPRRCFTLLFPSRATWWLFGILILLNGLDLVFFILLDGDDGKARTVPSWMWTIDGLFQVTATRTAGFSIIHLLKLHPAMQVSFLVMMYISVFPTAISMRRTNVYEEKSLGIYIDDGCHAQDEQTEGKVSSLTAAHLRQQLGFDLWYIFLGLFLIALIEGDRLLDQEDPFFNMFSVMFEIVSAYGTVGLSLGYPDTNTSFSGQLKPLSKLVIIAMQIRGRHRGLPYQLDRAVLLPSESLNHEDLVQETMLASRRRRSSAASHVPGNVGWPRGARTFHSDPRVSGVIERERLLDHPFTG